MWLRLTADFEPGKTMKVLYNTDNIVSIVPRAAGPSEPGAVIFALDGSRYPVLESVDQIDACMADHVGKRK